MTGDRNHPFELRTLRYFTTLVREGGISNAAKALHITQPTLSRQISELEANVGSPLYEKRGGRLELTDKGRLLYERAKTILELADQTEEDLEGTSRSISGTVRIGAGESTAMALVAQATRTMCAEYPNVSIHLSSGFTMDHLDNLNKGVLDFVLECETVDRPGFEALELPLQDRWVVLIPEHDPLAAKDHVEPGDFAGTDVLLSRQALKAGIIRDWLGPQLETVNVVATHNLTVNSSFLCRADLGYLFTYDGLYEVPGLVSRPLAPELRSRTGLIWVKRRPLSGPARIFLEHMRRACDKAGITEG